MKHGRSIVAALLGTALLIGSLSGCGSTEPSGGSDGEYQKINLSMAVNGTDTQIDSLVAHHFADLVEERSGGNVVIDVFSNDTLAGGNSTKGVEYIAVGGSDLGAYATCVLANLEPKMSVATLPWSFTSYQQARQVIDTTGGAYYAKLLEAKGITYLGSFHNGFRQLTNSKHPVTKPEDLKDLKIRLRVRGGYGGAGVCQRRGPLCVQALAGCVRRDVHLSVCADELHGHGHRRPAEGPPGPVHRDGPGQPQGPHHHPSDRLCDFRSVLPADRGHRRADGYQPVSAGSGNGQHAVA